MMMKKLLVVVIAVAITLVGASAAMAVIKNSKHDLSNSNTTANVVKEGAAGLSACQFCHTPHLGQNSAVDQAPLWNRTIHSDFTAADGASNYTVYGAGGLSNTNGQTLAGTTILSPGGNSKTCLSCHDGTLSLGDVLVGTAGSFIGPVGKLDATGEMLRDLSTTDLTTDLSNEHPIGFEVITDGRAGLTNIASMQTASAKFYTYAVNPRMECGTCHDPHTTGVADHPKFLRMNYSTMCTDCHANK